MNKITTVIAASLTLVSALSIAVQADAMKHKMAAKSMVCPYCHMKMMTVKSKGAPAAVKIKGVTYYCCTTCHPAPKMKKAM